MATVGERFAELLDSQDYQMITVFKQTYIDALKQYYFVEGCRKQYKVLPMKRILMRSGNSETDTESLRTGFFQTCSGRNRTKDPYGMEQHTFSACKRK